MKLDYQSSSSREKSFRRLFFIPVALFILMLIFLGIGLSLDPKLVPSPLIGQMIPSFASEMLLNPGKKASTEDLKGKPYLLNVWASWCAACRQEHPVLLRISESDEILVIGLNYKDQRSNSISWLENYGNPYQFSFYDLKGKIGMDLGVYGVPETFLVDRDGTIIYKHVGPLDDKFYRGTLLTKVYNLKNE